MIIEYKKQTALTDYFESQVKCKKFTSGGFLHKIGFKTVQYPDVYFHTGSLNTHSKLMIENSKMTIVNCDILKKEFIETLNVKEEQIEVIFPTNDVKKYKKSEVKKPFYEKYNLSKDTKIIYFAALDFKRNGFESFCDILTKIESTNFKALVTCTIDKELVYAKQVLQNFNLSNDVILIDYDAFNIADIYVQPTININFSLNVIKAITNKCAVFLPQNNNAIDVLDVFAIMDDPNDSNTAYKIDMLLRVPDELKKIKKENYAIGKKLNTKYMNKKIDLIIDKIK